MIDGTAGALEPLMWFYAKGKPVDRVEAGSQGAFAKVTNKELKCHLVAAVAAMGDQTR